MGRKALQKYAHTLLASCLGEENGPAEQDAPTDLENAMRRLSLQNADAKLDAVPSLISGGVGSGSMTANEDELLHTCKGAIELISRNSQRGEFLAVIIGKRGSCGLVKAQIVDRVRHTALFLCPLVTSFLRHLQGRSDCGRSHASKEQVSAR